MDMLDAVQKLHNESGLPYDGLRSVFEEELEWELADGKRRYKPSRYSYAQAVETTYKRFQAWLAVGDQQQVDLSPVRYDQANAAKVLQFIGSRRRGVLYCTFAVKTGQVKPATVAASMGN